MPDYDFVTYELLDEGRVARILLNRPDARNAQNRGMLVELAEWESLETRNEHMTAAMESGVFEPLTELMDAPFRVTVIRALS